MAFSFVDMKQLSCSKGNASDNTTHVDSGKNYEKNVCNSSELSVGRHKTELIQQKRDNCKTFAAEVLQTL